MAESLKSIVTGILLILRLFRTIIAYTKSMLGCAFLIVTEIALFFSFISTTLLPPDCVIPFSFRIFWISLLAMMAFWTSEPVGVNRIGSAINVIAEKIAAKIKCLIFTGRIFLVSLLGST